MKDSSPLIEVIRCYNVALPGIEPGSGASETHILSIVLQGQKNDEF